MKFKNEESIFFIAIGAAVGLWLVGIAIFVTLLTN